METSFIQLKSILYIRVPFSLNNIMSVSVTNIPFLLENFYLSVLIGTRLSKKLLRSILQIEPI